MLVACSGTELRRRKAYTFIKNEHSCWGEFSSPVGKPVSRTCGMEITNKTLGECLCTWPCTKDFFQSSCAVSCWTTTLYVGRSQNGLWLGPSGSREVELVGAVSLREQHVPFSKEVESRGIAGCVGGGLGKPISAVHIHDHVLCSIFFGS